MNKQQEPRLRFNGFTGAWVEKKLEDIFNTIRNAFVGTATPYYVENGHFYLESNNIKNGEINKKNQIFINDEFYYKQQDKWLKTNDLVMVQSGHVGHCAVIPEELNNVAAHALIMFSNYKLEANPYFLSYQFQTNRKINEIAKITTGNTIKHILSSDMKEFVVDFPMIEEQTHLGLFFRRLDSQIAESHAVLEKSRQLKKAMLAKMFPANGEKIPKIRFKGFEGEWECRKFSEVAELRRGLTYSPLDISPNGIRVLRSSNIDEENYIEKNDDVFVCERAVNIPLVQNGDILITAANGSSRLVGKHAIIQSSMPTVHGGFMLLAKTENPYFLNASMSSSWYLDFIRIFVAGGNGAIGNLSIGDLNEQEILIPKHPEEQTAIGNFFRQLDETIALQSAEVEKLNQLKKGLLAAMLV